jgi:hypothetical protein
MIIKSIGPPPERHADRIVAELMRKLARQQATLLQAVTKAVTNSTDGSPKAQIKMAARIKQAGGLNVKLTTGNRGRYALTFNSRTGWDPQRDAWILPKDAVPEEPWIAYSITHLSQGRGRERGKLLLVAVPVLLITHHAMSRAAQRLGLRTEDHLLVAASAIWDGAMKFLTEKKLDFLTEKKLAKVKQNVVCRLPSGEIVTFGSNTSSPGTFLNPPDHFSRSHASFEQSITRTTVERADGVLSTIAGFDGDAYGRSGVEQFDIPSQGWRVPIEGEGGGKATVVLKKHEQLDRALIAVTMWEDAH